MDERTLPPSIPDEALARKARLTSLLTRMAETGPSLEAAPLQALRRGLEDPAADLPAVALAVIEADLAEEAVELLREARRRGVEPTRLQVLAQRLEPEAAKSMARREAAWQLDARRVAVRLTYAKEGGALDLDDGDLHALLLLALRLEGVRVALDLGKRPRPLLQMDLPLPPGVGGLEELASLTLRAEPRGPASALLERLNARLPQGFRLRRWDVHPPYASSPGQLAQVFHWRWICPESLAPAMSSRTEAFLAASAWIWEKGGRVEGRKQVRALDLRPLVRDLRWEGAVLWSATGAEATANPLRLHAAVLGLDPADLTGLVRTAIGFHADPRLAAAERFEPKLKNIYEDAVLLGGGSNITLVDEDDDEPIRLG